jgi:peptidoglycan-N-acetylglucosamine deacetylase
VTSRFAPTVFAAIMFASGAAEAACPSGGLGVSRIVNIDASTGPLYGDITKQAHQANFLKPKEVVLTFDDGPLPWITKSILDTLERFCTKATFFSVGRMAIAYPETTRDIQHRGHSLGTHTWSHPMNMRRMTIEQSSAEIERGFAAVSAAAGGPIAPFFRFPGLSDSGPMLTHLQKRNVASFTVDVVSNDSFISSVERLTSETIAKVEARQGGIMLFHDIKAVTAKALPGILTELQRRGYRVVHMTSTAPFRPDPRYSVEFAGKIALAEQGKSGKKLMPFFGAVGPEKVAKETGAPIVTLTPQAVNYAASTTAAVPRATRDKAGRPSIAMTRPEVSAWTTTVRRAQRLRREPTL